MKLKYYLRGIGIGIIVTAIILSIVNGVSNSSNKMTNPQIVEKAKELGMVTKDEYDIVKQDLNTAKSDIDDLKAELSKADTKEKKRVMMALMTARKHRLMLKALMRASLRKRTINRLMKKKQIHLIRLSLLIPLRWLRISPLL